MNITGGSKPLRELCKAICKEERVNNCLEDTLSLRSTEEPDLQDLISALEEAISEAEQVADGYEESADNMEEHFSGSSQIDEIREKA